MERTLIKDLSQHIDEDVTIQGWLHTLAIKKICSSSSCAIGLDWFRSPITKR